MAIPALKLISRAGLALAAVLSAPGCMAYEWDFTLEPSTPSPQSVARGATMDVFANITVLGSAPGTVLGDGCLNFPSLCTGNEGFSIDLDAAPGIASFDTSGADGPSLTLPANVTTSVKIGALHVAPGAPLDLELHLTVTLVPDPVIEMTAGVFGVAQPGVVDSPSPDSLTQVLAFRVTAVPLPTSAAGLAFACALLAGRRRTRSA